MTGEWTKAYLRSIICFANDIDNWFVHASVDLPEDDPELGSMATFYHPIGRFEREIRDMYWH